jgi:hypothetical protein
MQLQQLCSSQSVFLIHKELNNTLGVLLKTQSLSFKAQHHMRTQALD